MQYVIYPTSSSEKLTVLKAHRSRVLIIKYPYSIAIDKILSSYALAVAS